MRISYSVRDRRAAVNSFEVKDALPVVPLIGAIFSYWANVKARLDWASEKKRKLGPLGGVHWFVDILPNRALAVAMLVTVASSLAYFAYSLLVDPSDQSRLARVLQFNHENFPVIFIIWLLLAVLAYFNWVPLVLERLASPLPFLRETIGFVNASWHVEQGEKASAVVIADNPRPFVDEVVADLAKRAPNRNMALRPENISDEEAANILYFGHVMEQYYSDARVEISEWTAFYSILGSIANHADRPFSKRFVGDFELGAKSYFGMLLERYNSFVEDHEEEYHGRIVSLPDAIELEQRVDTACRRLRDEFGSDARNVGRLIAGFTYGAVLRNVAPTLPSIELARQFAKLCVVWRIWRRFHKPSVFQVPFSRHIFILFLDKGFLVTDADEFNTEDSRVRTCMEQGQQKLLQLAYEAIEATRNPAVTAWREGEKKRASELGIEWRWYVFYRVDQHVYHLSRTAGQDAWTYRVGTPVITKTKPAS
jgi:hypothetical protein